ncbi:inhibitor of growth proteins N-terminal histone-binding-domain-containing protein [Endogone sp. FLAS-F59071]|nr:inhibitor of growth proteins N-terminal histone-binding-domain-containing protein [Endogone sp. FLAS-F59071]|eukprot:RUS14888.1 inhibitor of growth proteins N-terminal histone-binding-domain-containing protein [Endogone sp. FLAS-F59071]
MKPTAAARQADTLVYLDDYIDTVEALPLELQRNFTLMRELDGYAQELMEIVANESLGFIDNVRTMTLDERLTKLKQLGTLLSETLKRGEEKVALAKSTYDTVDRHCTRLDTDLQKFEDEQMIGPGRINVQLSSGLLSRKEDGVGASGEKKSKAGLDKKDKEARGEKRAANGAYVTRLERKLGTKDVSSPPPSSRASGTLKDGKSTKGNGGEKDKAGSAALGAASGKTAAGIGGGTNAASKSKGKEKGSEKEKGVGGREDGYGAGAGGNAGSGNKEKGGKKATATTSDMPIDPNEPLYCYCQQVSFGEMVACDNEDVLRDRMVPYCVRRPQDGSKGQVVLHELREQDERKAKEAVKAQGLRCSEVGLRLGNAMAIYGVCVFYWYSLPLYRSWSFKIDL